MCCVWPKIASVSGHKASRYTHVPMSVISAEGYPTEDFIRMVCEVRPTQVTLVPDAPTQLTSNAGWDTVVNADFLREVVAQFHQHDIRVSLFIDPVIIMADAAKAVGADRIEMYTEPYAAQYAIRREEAVAP